MPRIIPVVKAVIDDAWFRSHFKHVEEGFREAKFEPLSYDDGSYEIYDRAYGDIIDLKRPMTTEQVMEEYYRLKMRPATLHEHMGYVLEYRKELRKEHFFGLGSITRHFSHISKKVEAFVVGVWSQYGDAGASLSPFIKEWPRGTLTLGIQTGRSKRTVL